MKWNEKNQTEMLRVHMYSPKQVHMLSKQVRVNVVEKYKSGLGSKK